MHLETTSGAPQSLSLGNTCPVSMPYVRSQSRRTARRSPPRREHGWPRTYVIHVLAEQVLQRLPHGVALGHDPLPPVVACARGVGHERGPADNALQPLLQGRPEPGLAERHGVQDNLILKVVQQGKKKIQQRGDDCLCSLLSTLEISEARTRVSAERRPVT